MAQQTGSDKTAIFIRFVWMFRKRCDAFGG